MVKAPPKRYLWQAAGGQWYVRRKGVYSRIMAAHGSAEFDQEYWGIMAGKGPSSRRTWRALIESYQASDRWSGLRSRSRADYQAVLSYLIDKNADRNVVTVSRADALAAMQANAHRVRFANYIAQVMSILCEHAVDLGWIKHNPVKGVRRLKTPMERQKAHVPWTDDAVAIFRRYAQPLPRLIFELGVGSVQRPSDLTRFTWADYDGDSLRIVQGKTGAALHLPCTMALRNALDAARPAPCDPRKGILRNTFDQPMTYHTMSAIMLSERRRLGLEAYDLHGMRYRGVMELAWAGCNDGEIAAYSGHASVAMVRKYAGIARQVMQARSAREKRG